MIFTLLGIIWNTKGPQSLVNTHFFLLAAPRGFVCMVCSAFQIDNTAYNIANQDADFCIPLKRNDLDPWYADWHLYKERHLVEAFFLKLKEFRRVATRYDKCADRFLAFVHLACIRILLA